MKVDKDKIFINFQDIPKEVESNKHRKPNTLDYLDNYMLWCLKFIEFRDYFIIMDKNNNNLINLDAAIESSRVFLNNKAWGFIKKIKPDLKTSKKYIKELKNTYLLDCIKFSINTFSKYEQYEKCHFLQKFKIILEEDKDNLDM